MTPRGSTTHELTGRTEWVFERLAAGAYDDLAEAMAPGVQQQLTRELVLDTWASAVAEYGALESCDDTRLELPDGTAIDDEDPGRGMVLGHTVLKCEAGSWWGRVAFDAEDRIAGILVVPVGATGLPF